MDDDESADSLRLKIEEFTKRLKEKEEALQKTPKKQQRKDVLQVSESPERRQQPSASASPKSPQRVLLGLERKIKAKDVSLKRTKSSPSPSSSRNSSFNDAKRQATAEKASMLPTNSFGEKLINHKKSEQSRLQAKRELEAQRVHSFGSISQQELDTQNGIEYENYSKLRLNKKLIDTSDLERALTNKKVLLIPQLCSIVCPPRFEPPNYPNFVVIGIVCNKSEVKFTRQNTKYIVLSLTDLSNDIQVTLRNEAMDQYWNVGEGTVVAILNPEIYVKANEAGGNTFGLLLSSEFNTVIQIGRANDFGYCRARTKSGTKCKNWVNSKRNDYCEFHTHLSMNRARTKRQELNAAPTKTYNLQPTTSAYSKQSSFQQKGSQHNQNQQHTQEFGKVYHVPTTRLNSALEEDPDHISPAELARRKAKRAKNIEREDAIRKKLARRPEAFLMRDYDAKGNLIQQEEELEAQKRLEAAPRLFTPEQVRKLGFDPTKKDVRDRDRDRGKDFVIKGNAQNVSLTRAAKSESQRDKREEDGDSSDELEII